MWCVCWAMLRSWSWLRTILSNWEYVCPVLSGGLYSSIAIGWGSSSSWFPPLVPASWSFAPTSMFAPWSPSTFQVLPTLVNSILCIFSVETWLRRLVDSSSSPSTSTPKCSMNLEMSTTYGSLKSVSLFAFIIWSWIVYVQSNITPFWMQYITTRSPSFNVAWLLPLGMMILVTTMPSNLSSTRSLPTWKFLACSPWFLTHWLLHLVELVHRTSFSFSDLHTSLP